VDFEKQTGVVAWFSARKGYGFITPDDPIDNSDVFVHWSGIAMDGYKQLQAGDKVEYVLSETAKKGIVAIEVKVIR
jgi:CspA family cold shock protein